VAGPRATVRARDRDLRLPGEAEGQPAAAPIATRGAISTDTSSYRPARPQRRDRDPTMLAQHPLEALAEGADDAALTVKTATTARAEAKREGPSRSADRERQRRRRAA